MQAIKKTLRNIATLLTPAQPWGESGNSLSKKVTRKVTKRNKEKKFKTPSPNVKREGSNLSNDPEYAEVIASKKPRKSRRKTKKKKGKSRKQNARRRRHK